MALHRISKIIAIALLTFIFTAGAAAAAYGETALTVTLFPNATIGGDKVTLGDISNIKISETFKCDPEKIKGVELGFPPGAFMERKITAGEVAGVISKKIKFPEGSEAKMAGAPYCMIKCGARPDMKKWKAEFAKKLEGRIAEIFMLAHSEDLGLKDTSEITIKLVAPPGDSLSRRIAAAGSIKIELVSYKAGMAFVAIMSGSELLSKVYARVIKKTRAYRAAVKIARGSKPDPAALESAEIEIIPEKQKEIIDVGALVSSPAYNPEDYEFSKDIFVNELITVNNLKRKILVRAGQKILLSVSNNNSIINIDAVSEESGSYGDVITVSNPKTHRRYKARIIDGSQAEACSEK